jgi:hypothetical protein
MNGSSHPKNEKRYTRDFFLALPDSGPFVGHGLGKYPIRKPN